jgi:hypothetical protein
MSLSSHWDSGRIKTVKEIDTTSLDRTREKERLMSFGRKENVSNSYRILHYVDKNNCSLSEKQSITRQINKVPMRSTHPDCQSSKQQCPVASQRRERTQGGSTATLLLHWIKPFGPSLLETCDGLMRWIRPSQKCAHAKQEFLHVLLDHRGPRSKHFRQSPIASRICTIQ